MEILYKHFPDKLVKFLENYSQIKNITEIRLRAGNTVQFTENGKKKDIRDIFITKAELEEVFFSMCEYSQNAYEDEISYGFITLENGFRVGIGGEFYHNTNTDKYLLRELHSVNIRIPRKNIYFEGQELLFDKKPVSTLIIGPPHSGKTSLIKIYTEYLQNNNYICICDERKEIFVKNLNCDVIKGIKKSVAIEMATRTLNPHFILCDEISDCESEAIMSAINTGVEFICSVHGKNLEEISLKKGIKMLIENRVFKRFVMLSADNCFKIKEITDV